MGDNLTLIRVGGVTVTAALNDSTTADAVWGALPITGRGSPRSDRTVAYGRPNRQTKTRIIETTATKGTRRHCDD